MAGKGQGPGKPGKPAPPRREAPPGRPAAPPAPAGWECEAEVIPGLEGIAQNEIVERFARRTPSGAAPRPVALRFRSRGSLRWFPAPQAVVALPLGRASPARP